MRTSVRLGLAFTVAAMALACAVVWGGGALDVFLVLLLIALLVLRELLGAHATAALRTRVGVFVFLGVVAFGYIIVQRVRAILGL